MSSIISAFNRLLPFATPGTPLVQDLLHLTALCGVLYFAPQIQEWWQRRSSRSGEGLEGEHIPGAGEATNDDEARPLNPEHGRPAAPNDIDLDRAPEPQDAAEDAAPAAPEAHAGDDAAPAGPARAPMLPPPDRTVGAKKMKSLAKKDQRRAYHEFQRAQGEAQREQDAQGAAEREAGLAAERERRRAAEAAIEARRVKEREEKRRLERRDREEEMRRRERVVGIVMQELEERRMCDLFAAAKLVGGDVDEEWVEKVLKACDVLGNKDGVVTMITGMGWAVRITEGDMATLYRAVIDQGRPDGVIGYEQLGGLLMDVLKTRPAAYE